MDTAVISTARLIPAEAVREGAGVTVHRTIGGPTLRNFDPFLLLDHISSDNPNDYIAGFPSHPHRGFSTFTYMIDGLMKHQDSMGNSGILGPGSAQWMKAASGIIHSEMPEQQNGLLRGFQLWINLPALHKMDQPEYQEFPENAFPIVETSDYRLKVLIGQYAKAQAPIEDNLTEVVHFDIQVKPGKQFHHVFPVGNNSFVYVFEGTGHTNTQHTPTHSLMILDSEESTLNFVAGPKGARMIVGSGKPIDEAIARHGPFVMNTREQIDQAMRDFQANDFVRNRAWVNRRS
jgi:redox-sensitive bicupin YhaK (pirin superfamily)